MILRWLRTILRKKIRINRGNIIVIQKSNSVQKMPSSADKVGKSKSGSIIQFP
jgi:hypothetical protein